MGDPGLRGRVYHVPARHRIAVARELGERRAAPHVRFDAPVLREELRRRDCFTQDDTAPQQLHAKRFGLLLACLEQVHALDDVRRRALRHRRVRVVLVHHRDVVIDILLLGVHAAQSVLDYHRDLVAEGRVVRNAVRHRRRVDVRMAVFVLQAFAVEGGAPGGAAEQETARAHVARGPGEIADPLEAEHRIEDVERDHRYAVRRIARRRGDPVAHRAWLVDALLQDLPILAFLVEHELIGVLRRVELAELVPDPELPEHAFHSEGARFVGHDRDDAFADVLVADERLQDLYERHGGRYLALLGAFQEPLESRQRRHDQRLSLAPPRGQKAAEVHAPGHHVFGLA